MSDDDNDEAQHFNPHQDREKRKQVRYEYRELITETESKCCLPLEKTFKLAMIYGNSHFSLVICTLL